MPNDIDRTLVLWDWYRSHTVAGKICRSPPRCGGHPDAFFMPCHGMFPLLCVGNVQGHDGPVVVECFGGNVAALQHAFDSQYHPGFEAWSAQAGSEVADVGGMVHA